MSKPKEVSIAFSGAGFLGAYYAGVLLCLKRFAPKLKIVSATGASAGALAACCLLSKKPAEEFVVPVLTFCNIIRGFTMGSFSPGCHLDEILKEKLDEMLPDDILDDVNGRLHVSVTRVRDKKNFIITEFSSRADLIDCIRASSFVPVFSGMIPPVFRGERFMDGMFTNNSPQISDNSITVSPFGGYADICPLVDSPKFHVDWSNTSFAVNWDNLIMFWMSAWPQKTRTLLGFGRRGFKRTMRYLVETDHIRCENCSEIEPYKPCAKCHLVRFEHLQKDLPEDVLQIIDGQVRREQEQMNKNRTTHTIKNVASVILLPITLPVELVIAVAIFCTPSFRAIYDFVKKYFVTEDVIKVVAIAVLIPIEICSAAVYFCMPYLHVALRYSEEALRPKISSVDVKGAVDRFVTVLLIGIVLPMEIWSFLFFVPYYVVTKLPVAKQVQSSGCDDGNEEKWRASGEKQPKVIEDEEEKQELAGSFGS